MVAQALLLEDKSSVLWPVTAGRRGRGPNAPAARSRPSYRVSTAKWEGNSSAGGGANTALRRVGGKAAAGGDESAVMQSKAAATLFSVADNSNGDDWQKKHPVPGESPPSFLMAAGVERVLLIGPTQDGFSVGWKISVARRPSLGEILAGFCWSDASAYRASGECMCLQSEQPHLRHTCERARRLPFLCRRCWRWMRHR